MTCAFATHRPANYLIFISIKNLIIINILTKEMSYRCQSNLLQSKFNYLGVLCISSSHFVYPHCIFPGKLSTLIYISTLIYLVRCPRWPLPIKQIRIDQHQAVTYAEPFQPVKRFIKALLVLFLCYT